MDKKITNKQREKIYSVFSGKISVANIEQIITLILEDRTEEVKELIRNEESEISDEKLRECIQSLQNLTWDDDAPLRLLALEVHGDDTVMHMLALAVPLAVELNIRTR